MRQEQEAVRQRLDDELSTLRYNGTDNILSHTHPRTIRDRLRALWNREISIPLVPIGLAAVLLISWPLLRQMDQEPGGLESPSRQLIEIGGSTYWSDDYDKAVRRHENHDQS